MTPEWLLRVLRRVGIGRPSLAEGQVWRYATRDGEEDSRVHILRIESYPHAGEILHIAVTGLREPVKTISHLPIARESLERSGLTFESRSGSPPDWKEGYGIWREEFDAGRAGVFTGTVAEIVGWMEEAVVKGTPV